MENHFGGNSDSAEVMYVKLFQGIEGIYPKPSANSISLKETLSMPLIIKLWGLDREIFLGLSSCTKI